MSLKITAQNLVIMDPAEHDLSVDDMQLVPLQVDEIHPDYPAVVEPVEVNGEPVELEIVMDLPGAPPGTKDPEPVIEVMEKEEEKLSDEETEKLSKSEKWDWSKHGPSGFIAWVKERCDNVPKHSGYDSAGLERAVAYLERLDNEVSKAMRMDLDGDLDANQIEKVRAVIDNGIERLLDRLDKVKTSKKKSRKKKSDDSSGILVKEGQKITGVQGIYIVAPLLISRIARVCINGMVSGGHDIEDLFTRQAKKYNLNEREKVEVMQLLSDMGYPLRQDRGYMLDEDVDVTSSDNFDWAANYKG